MIAFPMMLEEPARQAGIPVPEDSENYEPEQFPRFHLFCCAQLRTPMPEPGCHWENAKVIAEVPEDQLTTITAAKLSELGFRSGASK